MEQTTAVQKIAEGQGPLSTLQLFGTSKESIALFSDLLIREVEEGRVDALKVAIALKSIEKIQERVGEVLKPYYLSEAQKHSAEKPYDSSGAEIQVGENGVKYDYSGCGHPEWTRLQALIEEAIRQQKEPEALLKALRSEQTLVIEGEAVTVRPPVKKGSLGIKIKIK